MIEYPIYKDYPEFKNTKEMFLWIYGQRAMDWVSDLSGKRLLPIHHWQWHWQFLHVLSKNTYPKWKLNPNNILLGLPEEHERQNQFDLFNYYRDLIRHHYEVCKNEFD